MKTRQCIQICLTLVLFLGAVYFSVGMMYMWREGTTLSLLIGPWIGAGISIVSLIILYFLQKKKTKT